MKSDAKTAEFLENLRELGKKPIIADDAKHAADQNISFQKRVSSQWAGLADEAKVATGMNFIVAGLFAAGAFRQLYQAMAKDENGERHIQPTQFGLGIVMGLLAVGSAYLGAKPLMAVAR